MSSELLAAVQEERQAPLPLPSHGASTLARPESLYRLFVHCHP